MLSCSLFSIFLLSMIAVKTTKFFVRALTFKEFSHNTYSCSLGVLQIIQFLNFIYLNARRQRKLNFNSVAVSHMDKSPPHPECLCADQLTGTRMTPLRVFAAPNKTQQYFLTVYTLEPRGTETLLTEYVHHGVSTGLLVPVTILYLHYEAALTCQEKIRLFTRSDFLNKKGQILTHFTFHF